MSDVKVFSDKIRKQIENDPSDPEIFNNLKLLANFYFRGVKFVNNEQQLDSICNIAAEDMYMKIYNGMDIKSPISYLYSYRYTYWQEMRKFEYSEIIECEDYDTALGVMTMCSGSSITLEHCYDVVWIKDYLNRIPKQIDTILESCCRYKKGTSIYRNIYNSILLSLMQDKIITFFIEFKIYNYFLLMLNKVKDELFTDIKNNLLEHDVSYFGNLDLLLEILRLSNIDMYMSEGLND